MVKMKDAASDAVCAWLHTSSFSADSEGVRSSSAGCTPCGKQNAAASGVTGLPGGYANSTCAPSETHVEVTSGTSCAPHNTIIGEADGLAHHCQCEHPPASGNNPPSLQPADDVRHATNLC